MSSDSDSENIESSSSSSSSDEELLQLINMLPRPEIYRQPINPMEFYNDTDFKMPYRFSKIAVQHMLDIFNLQNFEPATNRNFPVTAMTQLLTLRFFATGFIHF